MEVFRLGRRKMDAIIMVNWGRTRGIVVTDINLVEAVCLEPHFFMGQKYGAVLIHKDWKRMYILGERHEFTDDEYFELAERLFREKGIETP